MPPDTVLTNWTDLAEVIETHSDGGWLFRGESNANHPLKPKAGRFGTQSGAALKTQYKPEQEKAALTAFRRQARPYISHPATTLMEWLAIAQHHGMSTRLLDWTESLLVAAFFAAEKAGTKGDALIYGVTDVREMTTKQEEDPFKLRNVLLYRPPHITPRIPAQRSVFTVHPDPTAEYAPASLRRWRISSAACVSIKRALDACAVNEASLFPDLDGLSRYLGWKYKWGKL